MFDEDQRGPSSACSVPALVIRNGVVECCTRRGDRLPNFDGVAYSEEHRAFVYTQPSEQGRSFWVLGSGELEGATLEADALQRQRPLFE